MPTSFEEEMLKKSGFDDPLKPLNKPLKYKPVPSKDNFVDVDLGEPAASPKQYKHQPGAKYSKGPAKLDSIIKKAEIQASTAKAISDIDKAANYVKGKPLTSTVSTNTVLKPLKEWDDLLKPTHVSGKDFFSIKMTQERNVKSFGLKKNNLPPHLRTKLVDEELNTIKGYRTAAHEIKYKKNVSSYSNNIVEAKIKLINAVEDIETGSSTESLKGKLKTVKGINTPNALKSKFLKIKDEYHFKQALNQKIKVLKSGQIKEIELFKSGFDDDLVDKKMAVFSAKNAANNTGSMDETTTSSYKKIKLRNDVKTLKEKLDLQKKLSDLEEDLLITKSLRTKNLEQLILKHKQEIGYLKDSHKLAFKQDMEGMDIEKAITKRDIAIEKNKIKDMLNKRKPTSIEVGYNGNKVSIRMVPAKAAARLSKMWKFWKL